MSCSSRLIEPKEEFLRASELQLACEKDNRCLKCVWGGVRRGAVLQDGAPNPWNLALGNGRIELDCKTHNWYLRIAWWCRRTFHTGIGGAQLGST